MIQYFAYGSNLDRRQMRARCPTSVTTSIGCLRGYRLEFMAYSPPNSAVIPWNGGAANIAPASDSDVWGLVYRLTAADLISLDRHEGYPALYTRFQSEVETPNGILSSVWAYKLVGRRVPMAPDKAYLRVILKGAEEVRLPEEYRQSITRLAAVAGQP